MLRIKYILYALVGSLKRLAGFAKKFPRTCLLTAKKLKRVVRSAVKGIFPPIGIFSILFLAVLTVGAPGEYFPRRAWPVYLFLLIGLLFIFLVWRLPRQRYSVVFASIFGWVPVFVGALSYPFWIWYANGHIPNGDFFHAAADVLPVPLLAAVIDVRRTKELEGKQLVLPIAAVFLGELAALNSLAFSDAAGPANFAVVSSSLVTATVALVLAVLADIAPPRDEKGGEMVERLSYSEPLATGAEGSSKLDQTHSAADPSTVNEPVAAPSDAAKQSWVRLL